MKRLAIIHTTPVTVPAIKALIQERTKDVEVMNLLDDSMLPEINQAGCITEAVKERLVCMIQMARLSGAKAVLSACSSIGGAVEEAGADGSFPVYRIDGPMAAAAAGYERIGVAATLRSTIAPTTELIRRKAAGAGKEPRVESLVIEGAGNLLSAGKEAEYDALVRKELNRLARNNDIVVLAQASMARAVAGLPEEEKRTYLTSPVSGVEAALCALEGL